MDIRNFFGSSGKKKPKSGSASTAAKDAASTGSETDSDTNSNDARVPASKSTAARRSPPKAAANKKATPQMKKVDAFASSSDEEPAPKNNGGGKKRSISSGARGNEYDSDSSGDERREAEMRRARENAKRAKLALGEAVEEDDKEEDAKVGRAVKEMQEEMNMNMGTPRKRKEPASSSEEEEVVTAKHDGGRKGRRQIADDSDSDDSAFEVKTKKARKGAAKKKAVDSDDSDDDFKPAGADGDSDDDHLDADEYGSEEEEEEEEEKPKKKRRAASPKKKKAAPKPKKKASPKKKAAAKKEPEPEGPPKYHPPSSKLTSKIPYLENNPKVPPLTKAPALPPLPKNDPNFDIDAFTPRCLEGLTFVFSGILSTNAPKTIATSANVGMNSPTKGDYYANRNLDCADDNCELSREAASDVVKSLGGRVTSAVSGKTDYLILGCVLEDGRGPEEGSKYRKATEVWENWEHKYRKEYGYGSDSEDEGIDGDDGKKKKGKKKKSAAKDRDPNTLVEVVRGIYEFYGLVAFLSEWKKGTLGEEERAAVEAATPAKTEAAAVKSEVEAAKPAAVANPYAAKKPVANPYAQKKPANPYASASKPVNPYGQKPNPYAKSASASAPAAAPAKAAPPKRELGANALWADKYAPAATGEILGNADSVNKLKRWLNNWENVFNNPKRPVKSLSGPNGPWKAALLSGPPGIGKTTTATLVGQESGRDVLELNASDARSKKALSQALGDVTGSQVLSFGNMGKKKGSKTVAPPRRVVIMDEVDGMGAGDRSGMSELIQMIKKSKVPIICICNDRSSQKMKSLTQYCMDLRYRRPTKMVIARRAVEIGKREGMEVEPNAAEAISESCGNDIRQVLNCLQMWSCKGKAGGGGSASMTYRDLKERQSAIKKDEVLRVSMFDACKQIVEGSRGLAGADAKAATASLLKRTDAFFVDYMLMGLMVHQNYLKVCSGQFNNAKLSGDEDEEAKALESIYQATEAMSDFGMCEENLRGGDQNWSLLPLCSVLAVKVGHHAGGPSGGFLPGYAEFAGWLGKNSTRNKKIRLLQELRRHMNYKISADAPELRMTYLPMVRQQFQQLLFAKGGAKVPEAIALMDEYGLDRDDVFENLDEFVFNSASKEKKFGDLDSKSKAAFTRAYNAMAHTSQALVAEQGAEKTARKKGNGGGAAAETAELDVCDDDKAAAEESEDETEEDLEALTKKFLKKGRKKAAPKSKGKGAKGKKK